MCSAYSRPIWQGFGVAKVGNVAGVAGWQERQEESGEPGREKGGHTDAPDLDHPGDLRAVARSCGAIDGGLRQIVEGTEPRSFAEGLPGQRTMPNFGDCAVGSGQAEAALLSVQGRFIDGCTDSQKGTQQTPSPT